MPATWTPNRAAPRGAHIRGDPHEAHPEQLAQFDRDGYLFFPGLFAPDEVRHADRRRARALYARREAYNVREKGSDAVRTNFAAHMYSEPFARLGRHPRMIEPVQQLFGEKLYMHQFKINGKMAFEGDVWQWHQDYGTWKNDDLMPTERAMNVAIFLDDVNEFNGPLMFIPGSHKQGRGRRRHDLTTTSYPLWTVDHDADHAAGGARRRQASRRHRLAQGPGGLDAPVPLLPGACQHQQL
jgi:ectoine hydroxylase